MMITAEAIKSSITVPMILERFNYPLGHRRRCPCPLHNGKDENFSYDDHYYYCFVCNKGGDEISLYEELANTDFRGALKGINQDFGLGLEDQSEDEISDFLEQIRIKNKAKAAKKAKLTEQAKDLAAILRQYRHYEQDFAPKNGEEPSKEYIDITLRIKYAEEKYWALYRTIDRLDE